MSTPLYQAKAEFFKALAHPARIRVLELLSEREHSVSEMLPEVGLEAAHLSQQLSVLRKMPLDREDCLEEGWPAEGASERDCLQPCRLASAGANG